MGSEKFPMDMRYAVYTYSICAVKYCTVLSSICGDCCVEYRELIVEIQKTNLKTKKDYRPLTRSGVK